MEQFLHFPGYVLPYLTPIPIFKSACWKLCSPKDPGLQRPEPGLNFMNVRGPIVSVAGTEFPRAGVIAGPPLNFTEGFLVAACLKDVE